MFWWPAYRLSGTIKLITAIVSWVTVLALVRVAPLALAMRLPEELEREIEARKQAEDQLQNANAELERRVVERTSKLAEAAAATTLLASIVDSSSDAIVSMSNEGTILSWNTAAERMFGFSSAEALGQNISLIVPRTQSDDEKHLIERIRSGEQVEHYESIRKRRSGELFPVSVTLSPMKESTGELVGASKIIRDITEQKKQAAALKEQERQFKTLAESIPQLAWMARKDGHIFWYNRRWYDFTGSTPEEMEGWGWQSVHDQNYLPTILENWKTAIEKGEAFEMTFPLRRNDGVFRTFLTRVECIKDDNGEVSRWFGTNTDITEQKRAEERFRSLVTASSQIVWTTNARGEAFENSISWMEFTGQKEEEWRGRGWMNAIHPEDRLKARSVWSQAVSSKNTFHTEYRLRSRDGSYRWTAVRGVPVLDTDGEIREWVGMNTDVTEQRRAEEALRLSDERYRATVENAAVGVCNSSPDGRYIYANRKYCEIVGYELLELLQQSWQELTHPSDLEADLKLVQRVRIGEIPSYTLEKRFIRKDGSIAWVSQSGSLLKDADDKIALGVSVIVDITERKEFEEKLRVSEVKRRLALDSAELGAWHIDLDNNTLIADERFQMIFNGKPGPLNYDQAFALVHPEDRERVRQAVIEAHQPDDPKPYSQEYRVVHSDSQMIRWVLGKGRVNFVVDGSNQRFASLDGTVADITERKEMENALRQMAASLSEANARKDEFLATLAHELRNPLAPIRNGLQVIRLSGGNAETIELARKMMERQLNQMVRLVDDLMDVSRITRGKIDLRRSRLSLGTILEGAVESSRPLIDEMGHRLTMNLPSTPIFVEADQVRLTQVFMNLLNNAAKYMDYGKQIWLTASLVDREVQVIVKDEGIGIASDKLHSIFELFTQVDRSLEKAQGGLGIGLTLVRSFVEMHGGSVRALSDGVGKGSEFVVRLPVLQESLTANVPVGEDLKSGQPPLRILIVDDNRDSADSLGMMLQFMGNEILTAYDGQQGIELAEKYCPEVVLLDIGLPNLNGYEVCRRIRNMPWGKNVILIACTGWGKESDRAKSYAAGFDHHLVKPVDPQTLLKLITGRNGKARDPEVQII